MSNYNPREYWTNRLKKEGVLYVSTKNNKKVNDHQWEVFQSTLVKLIEGTNPGRILDFGCGVGRFTKTVIELADSYVGVDINTEALKHAPAMLKTTFIPLPEDKLPFDDNSFDSIMAITVLQHIVNEEQYGIWSGELARVLKPGGFIYIIDDADQGEKIKKAVHMKIRSPEIISSSLSAEVEKDFGIISAERPNSHFAFRSVKIDL